MVRRGPGTRAAFRGPPCGPWALWSASVESPNRVLIAADIEASGIWLISVRAEQNRRTWVDRLGQQLTTDLKVWNDSADGLFGGRVRPEDRDGDAEAAYYLEAQALALRVQEKLGTGWEVLWNEGPTLCWSWIERPVSWRG
jgi:hypothetical protein